MKKNLSLTLYGFLFLCSQLTLIRDNKNKNENTVLKCVHSKRKKLKVYVEFWESLRFRRINSI